VIGSVKRYKCDLYKTVFSTSRVIELIIFYSLSFGLLLVLIEAAVDTFLIGQGEFLTELLANDRHKLWMRSYVFITALVFGGFSQYFLFHANQAELVLRARTNREKLISSIVDDLPNMIGYWDNNLRLRFANHAYSEWFGKKPEELIGITFQELVGKHLFSLNEPHIRKVLAGQSQRFERTLHKADGSVGHIIGHYIPDFDTDGSIKGFSIESADVTYLKVIEGKLRQAEKELLRHKKTLEEVIKERTSENNQLNKAYKNLNEANHNLNQLSRTDALTNIANRRHFDETLAVEARRLSRQKKHLTLMICDIDYFKQYNDSYGHQAGDICLQQVARSINSNFPRVDSDLVARYGGEEFAVILPNVDKKTALILAERTRLNLVRLALEHNSSLIASVVTLSIGVTTLEPDKSTSISMIIKNADKALYSAKTAGRNNVQYCS
jgi:diguanylate cyclase (GGDEF)-like protein/PAS domain S-box-containing protein